MNLHPWIRLQVNKTNVHSTKELLRQAGNHEIEIAEFISQKKLHNL